MPTATKCTCPTTTKPILSVMETGKLYKVPDLVQLTGMSFDRVVRRIRVLRDQGRLKCEVRTTRNGHLHLFSKAA